MHILDQRKHMQRVILENSWAQCPRDSEVFGYSASFMVEE